MKMEFEINYSNAVIDPNSAAQQISSLCYAEFENEDLIDCKAFNSINIFENQPESRSKRDDTVNTVIFVAAVARFKTAKSTDQQAIFIDNLKNRLEQDSSVRTVFQFIKPTDFHVSYIIQWLFLAFSSLVAIFATILQVKHYRSTESTKRSCKRFSFFILFEIFWPILGLYPTVFFWYEYQKDSKLMYDQLEWISSLLLYISIMKLILFILKIWLHDLKARGNEYADRFAVIFELVLEYEILSFILCDGLCLLVIYFFSSRFVIPEQEVNLVNFCLPLYFFISAFISGIYRLSMAIRMKVYRKKTSSVSTTGFELKFKRTIKIISEVAGLIVLGLTTALFLCSIAVTLCVHDTFTVDSRLFAQIDGEFKRREHPLSLHEESLSRPQYCEYFPELWFNDSLRYGPKCIKILQSIPGVRPQISPYFLEGCTNPLELVVFWAIISAMALQLTVLFVFICMRFDQIVRKNERIYRENWKEGKYKVADSITSTENRTLEHTTTNGEILLHKNDLPGYHEIVYREF